MSKRHKKAELLSNSAFLKYGAYKFTRPPTGDILDIERINRIAERLPNTHIVLHGSSSVPQDWLEIINENGGQISETYGVPVEEIVKAIRYGVRKVNIDTDLRLAATGAIRRSLAEHPDNFDPRKYFIESIKAMKAVCIDRYEAFGSAGQASRIKTMDLEEMATRYEHGHYANGRRF